MSNQKKIFIYCAFSEVLDFWEGSGVGCCEDFGQNKEGKAACPFDISFKIKICTIDMIGT